MKIVITILAFLYSTSSAARDVQFDDGSYYNDDYIHGDGIAPGTPKSMANPIYSPVPSVAVGEPNPNGGAKFPKQTPKFPRKKRRPAGGFLEVHSNGGSVGTFREVGGGTNAEDNSPGSR